MVYIDPSIFLQLSQHVATMVLDELLFCQLLEALIDRGRELATHRQAEHILNGTFQLSYIV